eukprot:12426396-Karenia_brevis.AAC.1
MSASLSPSSWSSWSSSTSTSTSSPGEHDDHETWCWWWRCGDIPLQSITVDILERNANAKVLEDMGCNRIIDLIKMVYIRCADIEAVKDIAQDLSS